MILGPPGVAVGAALLTSTIVVVSNVAGIRTGEWKGSSAWTMRMVYTAIVVLVVATTVVAVENYMQQQVLEVTSVRSTTGGAHGAIR